MNYQFSQWLKTKADLSEWIAWFHRKRVPHEVRSNGKQGDAEKFAIFTNYQPLNNAEFIALGWNIKGD